MLNYFGHRYIEIILVIHILKFFWYLGLMGVCFVFVVDLDIVVVLLLLLLLLWLLLLLLLSRSIKYAQHNH